MTHAVRQFWFLAPFAALSVGCGGSPLPSSGGGESPASGVRHPVVVRAPHGPSGVPTGTFDEKGRAVSVACATCHSTKPVNAEAKLGTPLVQFHQGLFGKHGTLSCTSCHNSADGYASLRLADGKKVPHAEVMTLCAQCHGPQYRDYQHGAHGGMTGFWDLKAGGRTRNNCIDCHDVHGGDAFVHDRE